LDLAVDRRPRHPEQFSEFGLSVLARVVEREEMLPLRLGELGLLSLRICFSSTPRARRAFL